MSSARRIRPHGPKLPVFKPDWPYQYSQDFQKTKIQIGDHRHLQWETTYQDAMKPRKRDSSLQSIDTATLQRTHWQRGNFPSVQESEYIAEYKRFAFDPRPKIQDKYSIQETHFNLGSGEPMEQREVMPDFTGIHTPAPSYKHKLQQTHFNLKDPDEPLSNSTYHDDYQPHPLGEMSRPMTDLQTGAGAKECFANLGAFPTPNSQYVDTYVRHPLQEKDIVPASAYVDGSDVNFIQSTTNKWQKTNWAVGGTPNNYNTTYHDDYPPREVQAADYGLAKQKKLNLAKDSFPNQGFPSVKESTMHEATRYHPGVHPPPPSENTAMRSHQYFTDFSHDGKTVNQVTYVKHPLQPVEPVDQKFQESNAMFGHPYFNERTTLYQDSYKSPPQTMERADYQAARNFHMGTHSKITNTGPVGITTYQAEYTGHPGVKPSEICDGLKGGHNIVPNEPRFHVGESLMKTDYKPPPKIDQAAVVDNNLQKSHIQLAGTPTDWSTTQQDYFRYYNFRFPGEPRYGELRYTPV